MRLSSILSASGWLLCGFGLGAGCDTSAIGVEDCRAIELARCAAARGCDLGVDSDSDQQACERFARDHCLHGLPLEKQPKGAQVDECVAAIEAAGACAKDRGGDTLWSQCDTRSSSTNATACQLIETPELANECAFLEAEPPQDEEPAPAPDAGSSEAGNTADAGS